MTMFLTGHTAETALANAYLSGDRITIGVRENEWRSGSTPILLAFTGLPVAETATEVIFKNPFNDVPVFLHIYPDDETIIAPQTIFYANEHFNVPNPYALFTQHFPV